MSDPRWIFAERLFDGAALLPRQALRVEDGVVAELRPARADETAPPGVVTPGFVDLQVNGGGGVLLNATPTAQGMWDIAAAHRRFGTVAVLPTVITDAEDVLARAVDAALDATGQGGVLGLHIEGPHIAEARRGTHKAQYVRPMTNSTLRQVGRLRAAGVPTLITVAPEAATPEQIAQLAATGAVVSLGHSEATPSQIAASLDAGARCFTHLFNAMAPLRGRDPGLAGAAINSDAYVGIICDGVHVEDVMVGLALRARPRAGRTFLVSDAMPTVGGASQFTLYGQTIRLHEGRLVNAEGSLAGAHTTLAEGLQRLVTRLGLPLEEALAMVTTVPRAAMGLAPPRILGSPVRDLLHLGDDLTVRPLVQEAAVDPA